MYDPWIWRTPTLDPMAEDYYDWSPYSWAGNNPISNIDPDGQNWYSYTNDDGVESVIWREGDAATINIDGVTYSNVGETYSQTLNDGSIVNYTQSEITSIVEPVSVESQGSSTSHLAQAAPFAVGAAVADGPIPIGDMVGAGIIIGALIWDVLENPNSVIIPIHNPALPVLETGNLITGFTI